MTHLQHEAISYTAGGTFKIAQFLALKGNPAKVTITQSIHKEAWDIGLLVAGKYYAQKMLLEWKSIPWLQGLDIDDRVAALKRRGIPIPMLTALNSAIFENPTYKAKASDIAENAGVGRKWKINGVEQ